MCLSMAYNIWYSIEFGVAGCCLLQIVHSSLWGGHERAEMDVERLFCYLGGVGLMVGWTR